MPRKKSSRKKNTSASSSAVYSRPKSPPLNPSSRKATPKAPARRRKDLAIISSLPRRTSPRIAALNRKKMIENGITPPPSEVAKHVVDGAHDQFDEEQQDRRIDGSNGPDLLLTDDQDAQQTQMLDAGENIPSGAATEPPPPAAPRRRPPSAAADIDFDIDASDQEEEEDHEEDEDLFPVDEEYAPVLEVEARSLKEAEEEIGQHAVILHFGNMHELAGMGISVGISNVKAWIYNNIGGQEVIGNIQFVRDLGKGFYGVLFEHAVTCSSVLRKKCFGGFVQVTAFKWSALVNDDGRQCSPRMLMLPGLPDPYHRFLDNVAGMFGSFMGSIAGENPRIAVMAPVDESIPRIVRLKYKGDKPIGQVVVEQLPNQALKAVISRGKRKADAMVASPASKQNGQRGGNKKRLRA